MVASEVLQNSNHMKLQTKVPLSYQFHPQFQPQFLRNTTCQHRDEIDIKKNYCLDLIKKYLGKIYPGHL